MKLVKLVLGLSLMTATALSSQSFATDPCGTLSGTPRAACEAAQPKPNCTTTYVIDASVCTGVPHPYYQYCLDRAPRKAVTSCK